MAAKRFSRSSPLQCPVCARTCLGPQGLLAHISARHPDFENDPAPEPEGMAKTPKVDVRIQGELERHVTTMAAATQELSPAELIDAAINKLKEKLAVVRNEIARLSALQAEEADLSRQLEEVTKSRAAFGKPEAVDPAVYFLNEQHEDKAPKAAKPKTRSAGGN
jgi:hypothetical protein